MTKGKILIVDDEQMVCKSLVKLLQASDYGVQAVNSGAEGLKAVKAGDFDAIMLDIKIGDTDGISLLKEIKKIDQNAVVIIVTGYPSEQTVAQALEHGAHDYVAKPFDVDKLMSVMEKAVVYRHSLLEKGEDLNGKRKDSSY